MTFTFNQLSKPIYKAIGELGYSEPTEIQDKAIPFLLENEIDFVGQAQTGTGKTAAFCLPLLEKLDLNSQTLQAVILSPTRELANQINQEMLRFAKYTNLKTVTVYGGVGYKDQIQGLRKAHVVIATPGRAIDLIKQKKLVLKNVDFLVIDEADEMLKMGFIEDVEMIMENIKPTALKWMFSATMPKPIVQLMQTRLDEPELVRIQKKTLSNASVTQSYCRLARRDFFKGLKAILFNNDDFYGIIFCETKEDTKRLFERINTLGKKAVALHGDLNQRQRDEAMEKFKTKKAQILVCTDVAARGIDVSEVTHVINMGLPRKPDSYVHRIGRTGRAGNVGKAISFVDPAETKNLRTIERLTKQKMERFNFPSAAEIKIKKVTSALGRMDGLKAAIMERKDQFEMDQSFDSFKDYLDGLSRDEVLKLMFTFNFNSDFRSIDESMRNLTSVALPEPKHDSRPPRGRRSRRSRSPRSRRR